MKKMRLLQSFIVIFVTISVRVRAIQLCCPEGEIYSKIGVEQTVSVIVNKQDSPIIISSLRIAVRKAMKNMAVSKQIKLFQSHGSQNSRTKASNYQVPFDKMCKCS